MAAYLSTDSRRKRAIKAALTRAVRAGERPVSELEKASRDFTESRARDYINHILSQRPPLTNEQRNRLAELLRPVRAGVAK